MRKGYATVMGFATRGGKYCILALGIFLLLISFTNADVADEDSCGYVSSSLTLNASSMNVSGSCFIVNASNIVLDGNGTVLEGNGSVGYGINITDWSNVTIQNFGGVNNFSRAIFGYNVTNSVIVNNTIVGAPTSNSHGIYLNISSNNNITGNNITTSGDSGYAISIYSSLQNIIMGNILSVTNSNGYGIRFQSSANSSTLSGNNITTLSNSNGIAMDSASNGNTITTNRVGTASGNAITISTTQNTISGNILSTQGVSRGMYFFSSASWNTVIGNNITTNDNFAHGIWLATASNNYFESNNMSINTGTTTYGILLDSGSSNNTFSKSTISTLGDNDMYVQSNNNKNNTLFDEIFNLTRIGFTGATNGDSLLIRWSVGLTVRNDSGAVLSGANVSVYNSTGFISSSLTNASGSISTLMLTEYVRNRTEIVYSTPHSLNVSKSGYTGNSTSLNLTLTQNTNLNLTLAIIPPAAATTTTPSSSSTSSVSTTVNTKIISAASADNPIDFSISRSDLAVKQVYVEVNKALSNVKFVVKKLSTKPTSISTPTGDLYEYVEFTLTNLEDEDIDEAKITFRVSKEWIEDNNLGTGSVILQRFGDDGWESLETTFIEMVNGDYSFEAVTKGFSYFAITEKVDSEEETVQVEEEEEVVSESEEEAGLVEEVGGENGASQKGKLWIWILPIVTRIPSIIGVIFYSKNK